MGLARAMLWVVRLPEICAIWGSSFLTINALILLGLLIACEFAAY